MNKPVYPPRKWASDRTLAAYYEVNRTTIWRWVKLGKIPAPVKIGENCTRFDLDLIEQLSTAVSR